MRALRPVMVALGIVWALASGQAQATPGAPPAATPSEPVAPPSAPSSAAGNPTADAGSGGPGASGVRPTPAWPPPQAAPTPYQPGWMMPPPPLYRSAPSAQSLMYYESEKKNGGIALLLEIVLPGVGSIYAGHPAGALITWGLMIGGVLVAIWGIEHTIGDSSSPDGVQTSRGNNMAGPAIVVGVVAIVGGRIYGLVDSYGSAQDYNRELGARLGLPEGLALGVVPIKTRGDVAWGPVAGFRF